MKNIMLTLMLSLSFLNTMAAPVSATDTDTLKPKEVIMAEVVDQKPLQEIHAEIIEAKEKEKQEQKEEKVFYKGENFYVDGIHYWGEYKWTWYSERVLPGGGLNIPGRHADEQGFICDENNFICLASGSLPKGTVVDTPFGKQGKIYDCGCASNVLDVYVNW